ncbi:hypothetical protein KJ633_07475 [bacterium]|nr:hypothetical protein [bacterium]
MDFQKILVKTAKILEELKIPYAITGGYAVSVWGRPRSTFDIDIIVEIFHPKTPALADALDKFSKLGQVDRKMMQEAINRKGEFNFIHVESGIKIDFWILDKNPFSISQLKRRKTKAIAERKIRFVSPEDLILSKLIWHKKSGSDYQLKDVESIIKRQKKLDWKYLKKWAAIQSTAKILEALEKTLMIRKWPE